MGEDEKRAALQRITTDLEQYVASYCGAAGDEGSSFSDQTCQDAALMLREALDRLDQSA